MINSSLWKTVVLILGDLLAIMLFVLIGKREHQLDATFLDSLVTAAPFIIAWLLVGGTAGVFKAEAYSRLGKTVVYITLVWLVAGSLGLALRAFVFQEGVSTPFIIVTLVSNLILLLIWRSIAAFALRK